MPNGGGIHQCGIFHKINQRKEFPIKALDTATPTRIAGISYFTPADDFILEGRDGKVCITLGSTPLPLEENDFAALENDPPSYDAVGRGIYAALRSNPDCTHNDVYASILKEGYPHLVSELATHIVMLDKKDVEAPYLDRKINYLKIVALMEPGNHRIPLEIGMTFLEKGMRLSSLQFTTVSLYRAEKFLSRAVEMEPGDVKATYNLGEVSYILGKYDVAVDLWTSLFDTDLPADQKAKLAERMEKVKQGAVSHVPPVDYLEVVATAFGLYEQGHFDEAAALLLDVLEDGVFRVEFPIAEIWYILGQCYREMAMPKYAEEYLGEALKIDPLCNAAQAALDTLYH